MIIDIIIWIGACCACFHAGYQRGYSIGTLVRMQDQVEYLEWKITQSLKKDENK